ncbi:MAG: heme NO-binding domain-containing protein [Granulosicoccus sp.]
MYGLVNRAMEDLVKTSFGKHAWQTVTAKAGVENLAINDLQDYEDSLTFDLVMAASEVFMQSPDILLRLFGRHWIMYTGREGWHEFFDMTCADSIGFLKQLDKMHGRLLQTMPNARTPKITLHEVADGYELDYESHRAGLALFFQGIVEGLVEYYEEAWVIDQIKNREDDGIDRFRLRLVDSVVNNPHKTKVA